MTSVLGKFPWTMKRCGQRRISVNKLVDAINWVPTGLQVFQELGAIYLAYAFNSTTDFVLSHEVTLFVASAF